MSAKYKFQFADAGDSVWMSRQLEHVRAEVLKVKFQELLARQLLPVDRSMSPGKESWRYYQYERVGSAEIVRPGTTDIPKVTVLGEEFTGHVRHIAVGYDYTTQDMRAAQDAGKLGGNPNLPIWKAEAALAAIEQKIDYIARLGSTADGLYGLLNQPNALTYTVEAGAGGTTWELKTPDEILKDLHGIANYILYSTKRVEVPDTIVLPGTKFDLLSQRMGDGSDTTILELFLRTSRYIKKVEPWVDLETAGSGSTARMVAYRNKADALQLIIPMEFYQNAPQQKGLTIETICEARCGGVVAQYPKSIAYGDGI